MFTRHRRRNLRSRRDEAPSLLPLLVMLLPVAFFYARQFSADGDCCRRAHLTEVPSAYNIFTPLRSGPFVEVNTEDIRLNGVPEPTEDALRADLLRLRNDHARRQPGAPVPPVLLAADGLIPFHVVERVKAAALASGYFRLDYVVEVADD